VILASDYELHEFQRQKDKRILIATFECAAVGINVSAGEALVFDQVPPSHLIMSQGIDRIHRIDGHFFHPEVRYYFMESRHPDVDLTPLLKRLPESKREQVQRFLRESQCQADRHRIHKRGHVFSHIISGEAFGPDWKRVL
jgi:hypothetical protein